jgi:hypothetical protein
MKEIRRPKSEIRKKAEIRNPKSETIQMRDDSGHPKWPHAKAAKDAKETENRAGQKKSPRHKPTTWIASDFGLRISGFFRISDFGLRISSQAMPGEFSWLFFKRGLPII